MTDSDKVREKYPDARNIPEFSGKNMIVSGSPNRGYVYLSKDGYQTAEEAWADAAARISQNEHKVIK